MQKRGVFTSLGVGLVLGLILAVSAVSLWPRSSLRPPSPPKEPEAPARAEKPAPPERPAPPSPAGTLLVTAPPGIQGLVPVAIASPERILRIKMVPLHRKVDLRADVPAERPFLVCALDNMSTSPATALPRLHAECEWPRPVVIRAGEWPRDIRLEFREAQVSHRIRVVARTLDEKPRSGVSLRVDAVIPGFSVKEGPSVAFVTTGPEGTAVSPVLAPGDYRVALQSNSNLLRPIPGAGGPFPVTLGGEGEPEVVFLFRAIGALLGVLRMEHPENRSITICEDTNSCNPFIRSLVTDKHGGFRCDAMPPGRYWAISWPPGTMEAAVEFEVVWNRTTRVTLAPAKGGVEVVGRFLDADGDPLKGCLNINNRIEGDGRPGGKGFTLDASGRLHATEVAPGPKLAIFWNMRDEKYARYLKRFTILPGAKRVDLGTFRIPKRTPGFSVRGTVVDNRGVPLGGGAVIALASVAAGQESWSRYVEIDGGGHYRFEGVEPGRYLLWHERQGCTIYVRDAPAVEITVGPGGARFDLHLERRE